LKEHGPLRDGLSKGGRHSNEGSPMMMRMSMSLLASLLLAGGAAQSAQAQTGPVQGVAKGTATVGVGVAQGTAQAGQGLAQGTTSTAKGAGKTGLATGHTSA